MSNDSNNLSINESLLAAHVISRPRLDAILEQATRCKLVYVIAGAGYGKTQAVRQYIEQQEDAIIRWVQLTESDNIGSRYWENLTHSVSFDNSELADRLRELGFPETNARFKQFAETLKSTEHRSMKTFLILDDFHLIHSTQALTFAERCAYLRIPGACVIIISRNEPEINAVSLFSKGQVSVITEEALRFTDEEASAFLKQRGIAFPQKNLPQIIAVTEGWALAIQLLSLVLKRAPKNLDLALGTMKQNVFKLLEREAFSDFSEIIQKTMVKLSLVSNLPLTILQNLFQDTQILRKAPQLASFVWFDSFTGEDRVHPLYWEFLQSKRYILSQEEKLDTYRQAAQWCAENNFSLDAMYYFAKSRDYERMVELLFSHPFKLPHDTCEYFLQILENLDPKNEDRDNVSKLTLKCFFTPLLLMGMGKYEEAWERTQDVIWQYENDNSAIAIKLLYASYSNLVYIDMYACTVTHKYNAPEYIKKSLEYFKQCPLPPAETSGAFVVADVRSMACLVGVGAELSEFDQFLEDARQTALYIEETHHSMYYGYDDLVACELAFYRNQPDAAKNYARQAIAKAREKKQYSIEAMAAQYLLRISLQEGDYPLVKEMLKQLSSHLEIPDFWNRQLLYDLFTGFFYIQIGLPGMAPSWLFMDEKEATSEVRVPARELAISVRGHIALKQYNQALTVLCNSYPREPQERFLLSELTLLLLTAVARLQTGDTSGAMRDFEDAYSLSFDGVFEMPFIELGKNLRPLITAASKREEGVIPGEWLVAIDRKAAIYAKKISVITNTFKGEKNIADSISLSDREREVLGDLYHGLTREEIAANRYLSVNTVKKTLQSVFIKLDANNSVDAIRVALEKKLIE